MKLFSKKEEKNKVGRPKLADMDLKKKSIIMCTISFVLAITLLVTGAFKLNIVSFNKMKGTANINLCTAENINPEVLYDAETNPNGFSPEFLSVVMSVGEISYMGPYSYNDSSKCSTITMEELKKIKYINTGNSYFNKINLSNAVGIQNLTNLIQLNLSDNLLTEIDVSNLTKLSELYLYNNQLISIDVSNLTNLTALHLSNNQLTDIDLSNLTNLTYLGLSSNQLTKIDVSYLTNLTYLGLSSNQLTEIDVSNLTKLYELYLDNNQLTDIDLSNLTNLTALHLSNNQLTDIDLSNLTNLTSLNLYNNQLTEINVSKFTNLTSLNLSSNQLTEIDVSNLTNLKDLRLRDNQLTNIGNISNLTNLTCLLLSNNKLADIGSVSNLTDLTVLWLFNNKLTDIGSVSNLTNLTELYLYKNELTDIGNISNLTNLTRLNLSNNKLTDIGVVNNLTNLTELHLYNNQLTDIGSVSDLINLTRLYLYNNQLINIKFGNHPSLNYFSIANNPVVQIKDITINNKGIKLSDVDKNITTSYPDEAVCISQPNNSIATCENSMLKRNSYGQTSLTIRYKVNDKVTFSADYNLTFEPAITSPSYDIEDNIIYTKGNLFDKSKISYDREKYTIKQEEDVLKVLDKDDNEIDSFGIMSYELTTNREEYNIDLENKKINAPTELYENVKITQFTLKPKKSFALNRNDDNKTLEIISKEDNEVIESFKIEAVDLEKITKESGFVDVNLFRQVLKTYRTNNSGIPARALTDQELETITFLTCNSCNISDLTGLEKLTSLTNLDLSNNDFESINLSKNTSLLSLNISDNLNLKSIDISNTLISSFSYSGRWNNEAGKYESKLESFKANNMKNLTYFSVYNHPNLTSIELKNSKEITVFYAYNNKLQGTVDLSSLPKLYNFELDNNEIEKIKFYEPEEDEEYVSPIYGLYINNNKISGTLDLSNMPYLECLDAQYNNLEEIKFYEPKENEEYFSPIYGIVINNNKLKGTLDLSNMPYLEYACVSNNEIEEIKLFELKEGQEIPQIDSYGYETEGSYNSQLYIFIANNNKLRSLNLSNHPNIETLMINNNPLNNIYVLKGDKKDYKKNISLSEELDFDYEMDDSAIASIKNDMIKGLKYGKTRLNFISDNLYGYELEYFDRCWIGWDSDYCNDVDESDFVLPYFTYLDVYVYDVESSEYKVDNDKKIIDLQYKDFDLNKVKLHLNDLIGVVENNKYIIKHGDIVVDEYTLKNVKEDIKITPEKQKEVSKMKLKTNNKEVKINDIEIKGNKISGVQLKMIEGKDKNIILTNDDFTLTINGLDVKDIKGSIDLTHELTPVKSSKLKDELSNYVLDGYVLNFRKESNLPCKALLEVNVGSKYKTLNSYLYKNDKFTLIGENLKVRKNKTKFYITKLGTYVLTDKLKDNKDIVYDDTMIETNRKLNTTNKLFIIIPIILVLSVVGCIVYKKRK